MGWGIGYDEKRKRDIGYGVPCYCDHPDCNEEIDRGLCYVCGGEPYGGDNGCGLYFCSKHLFIKMNKNNPQRCDRCCSESSPFTAKPDHPEWIKWKLTDQSWEQWRVENKEEVLKLQQQLKGGA